VIPPGWSNDWKRWDCLLTFLMFSPYFLRLPQIKMLVNVQYGIPGEVRRIMYSDACEWVLFSMEPDPDSDAASPTARASSSSSIAPHPSSGHCGWADSLWEISAVVTSLVVA
jgi:hypothetical protein